jgi:hypothetical protein
MGMNLIWGALEAALILASSEANAAVIIETVGAAGMREVTGVPQEAGVIPRVSLPVPAIWTLAILAFAAIGCAVRGWRA